MPYSPDNHVDDHVDDEIEACLDLDRPVSFFLFAGAGSGKTRSLVTALCRIRTRYGARLRLRGQRVAVITYTNAACDEITSRLQRDPLLDVSTIHSFVWSMLGGFNHDIRRWLERQLQRDIDELEERQRKGRGGKAARDREESIKAKRRRLEALPHIRCFTYNPSGDNQGRDSLSHADVIKMGADFLTEKPAMQRILVGKYPILLVDESQDTNKLLMEAFLKVQQDQCKNMCLGLFGDTMQRIYLDGKEDLGRALPADWAKPAKKMNHRCPRRIIQLINRIRSAVDDQEQVPRTDCEDGLVRLFILPSETDEKGHAERRIAEEMAVATGDSQWTEPAREVKTLILEHHMAARRMGFLEMFRPLYAVDGLKTGLRDGSLSGVRLFSELVLPTIAAKERDDKFALAAIVRNSSPLLTPAALRKAAGNQRAHVEIAKHAVDELTALCSRGDSPPLSEVLDCVSRTRLFDIPECLQPFVHSASPADDDEGTEQHDRDQDPVADAWRQFLSTPFRQIEPYALYVRGQAEFETHQGVKGREFDRVMVVMDDSEAGGSWFSYEKLFAAKEKSETDLQNERDGKDSSIARTRRLFYVTCSRAKKSLAIVAYSAEPGRVRDYVLRQEWFKQDEVRVM